jgi:hypothetical protein
MLESQNLQNLTIWDRTSPDESDIGAVQSLVPSARAQLIRDLMECLEHTLAVRLPNVWTELTAIINFISEDPNDDTILHLDCEGVIRLASRVVIACEIPHTEEGGSGSRWFEANGELFQTNPPCVRVSKSIRLLDKLQPGSRITISGPYGGSDAALVREVLSRESNFNKCRYSHGSPEIELSGGIFFPYQQEQVWICDDPSPDIDLSHQQLEAYRAIMQPGWHALCGGPGCGKTHILSHAANKLINSGNCVVLIAQTNANLFDLVGKVLRMSTKKIFFHSFSHPTTADLTHIPAQYRSEFVGWIQKNNRKKSSIGETVDLIITTAGGILDSIKCAKAVAEFAMDRKITVILDEASQIEHISVLGLIGLQHMRSHVIVCGDPWQISGVVKHDTEDIMTMSDTTIVHCFRDYNTSSKFNAISEYMSVMGINPTWNFLTESFRLYPQLCQWANNEMYHFNGVRAGFTSRKESVKDCITVFTIEYAVRDTTLFLGSSRANLYEIGFVADLVQLLTQQGIDPGAIVALSPYKAQADALTAFLHYKGFTGVRCVTIHTFNGQENDHIIVSLTGGPAFLDQDTLIHSLMTRNKEKLYVIRSRLYENLPPAHSLTRFLLHTCTEESFRRVNLPRSSVPSLCRDIGITEEKQNGKLKALVSHVPDTPLTTTVSIPQEDKFYFPPKVFRLEIDLDHTISQVGSGLTLCFGSVSFKFIDAEDASIHHSGKLCDAAFVSSAGDFSLASRGLLCQQIAKCAAYLLPSRILSSKYDFRNKCDGIKLRLYLKSDAELTDEVLYLENALRALSDYSALPLGIDIMHMRGNSENRFDEYIRERFNQSNAVSAFIRRLVVDLPTEMGIDTESAWANDSGGIVTFNGYTIAFTELLRCYHVNELLLGQSTFFSMIQGCKSFGWLHASVKSNYIIVLYAAALSGNGKYVWIGNENVRDVLGNCYTQCINWDSQAKDHLHSLEFQALGAFATRSDRAIPTFRLCVKQSRMREYLDCDLGKLLLLFKKPSTDFHAVFHADCSPHIAVSTSPIDPVLYNSRMAEASQIVEEYSWIEVSYPHDTDITPAFMLSLGYEQYTLEQAFIPQCRQLFLVVKGAEPKTKILDALGDLQSGVDYWRVWGILDNNRKRKLYRGDQVLFFRVIVEVNADSIERIVPKIIEKSTECPFKSARIRCIWCQFAEGNGIPEEMGSKPSVLLAGYKPKYPLRNGYMTNNPVCLCNLPTSKI